MLHGLDLFSGIGGISKALEDWVKPIAYCENDAFAQAVLLSRMHSGEIGLAPIWDDITTLSKEYLPIDEIDIIYGGFPCQDISVAGHGKGIEGERSGLFNEIIRLTGEIAPPLVFLENVPAIRTRGLLQVVGAFTELGYDCRWTIVSAAEVGACHIRKRWFLLAYTDSKRLREECGPVRKKRIQKKRPLVTDRKSSPRAIAESSSWAFTPSMDRTGDGLSGNVDRARALGNAVVPEQAKEAFKRLTSLHSGSNDQPRHKDRGCE